MAEADLVKELAAKLLGTPLSRYVTTELWDADLTADSGFAHLTTYIARFLCETLLDEEYDQDLFYTFREAFSDWTAERFGQADKQARKKLKTVLRQRGIHLASDSDPVGGLAHQLVDLVTRQDYPQWPDDVLLRFTGLDKGSFETIRRERLLAAQEPQIQQPSQTIDNDTPSNPNNPLQTIEKSRQNTPNQGTNQAQGTDQDTNAQLDLVLDAFRDGFNDVGNTLRMHGQKIDSFEQLTRNLGRGSVVSQRGQTPGRDYPGRLSAVPDVFDEYRSLPPMECPMQDVDYKLVIDFTKTWGMKEKYDGKPYNLLELKMMPFFNLCRTMKIRTPGYHSVFPYILTGQAEDYYLAYLTAANSFREIYDTIKEHFEHDVNKAQYHSDWRTTRFLNLMAKKKEEETPMDILNTMLDKLMICQKALGQDFRGEAILREQVRGAVTGVREFEYALQKPDMTCEGFFSELRTSLATVLNRTHGPAQLHLTDTAYTWDDIDFDTMAAGGVFVVDRKFLGNRGGRGGNFQRAPRGGYGRQSNWQARQGQQGGQNGGQGRFPARNGFDNTRKYHYRDNDHHSHRDWKYRCFVCGKEGCWSSNHSQAERLAARQQYQTEFPDADTTEYRTYVAEYEGDDLDEWIPVEQPTTTTSWMTHSFFNDEGQRATQ